VTEKRPVAVDTEKLNEYDRFLLDALLQQAAKEAGRPLSVAARRELTMTFFEERQQAQRAQINAKGQSTRSRRKRDLEAREAPDFQWQPPAARRTNRNQTK